MAEKFSQTQGGFRAAVSARFGSSGVTRVEQFHAAILLPVFIVASIVVAKALHTILLSFMPDTVAAISALRVILGTLLVIATGASWIVWVRSGGFGLFA